MKRSKQFFTAGIFALSLFMASGALAQDAAKVDPKHYKVEFENDQVRVLRITYGAGEKSVMHEHLASVAVFLADVESKFTYPDGKTEEITAKDGQAIWLPALKHQPENAGGPFELIQVEVKSKAEGMKDAAVRKANEVQDAAKLDPKHYKVELENDQVRVLRVTYGPGEKSVMHEHPDAVALFLTDVLSRFTFPDGKTQAMTAKSGQSLWTPAGKHLPENTGDKSFSLILVELKSKPAGMGSW